MTDIIRVFPKRTSYTPADSLAFYGPPPMDDFIPEHREVHISCVFTWDRTLAEHLADQWEGRTSRPVRQAPGASSGGGKHHPG